MRHGFLLIDKPIGPTSHDVVQTVRRTLGESKIGHLGTLDPAASGLLVLAVGSKALKVIELFGNLSKEYIADIRFGAVSTTYDAEGVIEEVHPNNGWKEPDYHQLRLTLETRFLGIVAQAPPAYSAVHIDGVRAHELARRGEAPKMKERQVTIESCAIVDYAYPSLRLLVACGSGTYIRSLAHDLGTTLRCGAYLEGLRRTMVGDWSVEKSIAPTDANWAHVLPLKEVLKHFPSVDLTPKEADDIRFGRKIPHELQPDTIGWYEGLPIAVLKPAKDDPKMAGPRKVL